MSSLAPAPAVAPWVTPVSSPAAVRRGRVLAVAALLGFAVVLWFLVPHGIGSSWRECDTQAIARNFLADGFDPLRPRVDWRGDGDGAVECEFPLYQLLIATALAAFGDVEWPGRLLALLSTLFGAWSMHRLLESRAGPAAALAGLLAFLCTGSAALLATRVMPDALSFGLGAAGLVTFVRYLGSGSGAALALASAAMALSALQKPLSLQLGMVMFAWTVLAAPRRLREPRLWLAFAAIPTLTVLWLWHGAALHAETGLSFGVVSGGDTKFPGLEHLTSPVILGQLLATTARHGFSVLGFAALAVLLMRRRLDRIDLGLLVPVAIGLLVSLRYSYSHGMGPHYHVFAALASAWCVARAWPSGAKNWPWLLFLVLVAGHAAWRLRDERGMRMTVQDAPVVHIAAAVQPHVRPGDLVVVRADKPRIDPLWRRANNFEDPRFLYLARMRGWVVPMDGFDTGTLEELRRRGARLVYDQVAATTAPEVRTWLEQNGELLLERDGVRVHRLRAGS